MPKLVPSQKDRQIYCFIGGAFRPPNHRHWQMISYFSDLVGNNGEVIVIVSNPQSSKYQNKHGFQDGHTLSTDDAVKVLEIFAEADKGRSNVTIMGSEEGSPVRSIYGMVTDTDTLSDCDVLIGCYRDENDFKKWDRLQQHVEEKNPSVTVLDYKKFAYRRSYENFAHGMSALQRRIGDVQLSNEEDAMPSFLSKEQMEECMKTIYGENWNKEETKKDEEKPAENQNENVNESMEEDEPFKRFETLQEFLDFYVENCSGCKVIKSEFDKIWGVLNVVAEDKDGIQYEMVVINHGLENPEDWMKLIENDFSVPISKDGMKIEELIEQLEKYDKDSTIKVSSSGNSITVKISPKK